MGVPMTQAIVLVICKTLLVSDPSDDPNSKFTGWEDREWATEHSMMVCKREVVSIMDGSEMNGADARPLTKQACMASAIRLGVEWDQKHRSSSYRVWRVACPTPMVNTETGEIVGWVLPDCGHRDVVTCLKDSVI